MEAIIDEHPTIVTKEVIKIFKRDRTGGERRGI
jgi:hypothetical protein